MAEKLTIEEMQGIAELRGGRCLSTSYVNNWTNLIWRCKEGHIWEASPSNIKAGKWCRLCGIKKRADKWRLSIDDMRKKASEKRGQCLSEKYVDAHTKLQFECKYGHKFLSRPNQINRGSWCPKCATKIRTDKRRSSIENVRKIAENIGIECLSTEYKKSSSKLLWRCKQGHTWYAIYPNIKRGANCPYCSHRVKRTIEEMRAKAQEHGGECLSEVYENSGTKLKWKCKNGHIWEATPSHILYRNQWCHQCFLKERVYPKMSVNCLKCGKSFFTNKATQSAGRGKYCSKICAYASLGRTTWTDYDVNVLKEKYYDASREEILALLPGKSWSSICQRARILKIPRSDKFYQEAIRELWENEDFRKKIAIVGKETYSRHKEETDRNFKKGIEYIKKHAKEMAAKRELNPEYRKRRKEWSKKWLYSKENREHLTKIAGTPEKRKQSSEKLKQLWKSSDFQQMTDELWKNQEFRRNMREFNKELWSDPEFRKRNAKGIARAARIGSKLEKYVYEYISRALMGIPVKFKDWSILHHQEIDISIPSMKIAIEVQGVHHFLPIHGEKNLIRRQRGDERKQAKLHEMGWKIFYVNEFTPQKVNEIEAQCDEIIHQILGFENWRPPQKQII